MPPVKSGGSKRRGAVYDVAPQERVLVALMNNRRDLEIAREQGWYRIPLKSVPRGADAARIAFYQTRAFGTQKWSVQLWADVLDRCVVPRRELLPGEPAHPRADNEYLKLEIGPLQKREPPILSKRGRRLVFIPTTWDKFQRAEEINDLFHDSPLEDALWAEFKRQRIEAERQFFLSASRVRYCLDFALFCVRGCVNVECDGDWWHAQKSQIKRDNERDNALTSQGWAVLRFNGQALRDDIDGCLGLIHKTVRRLGGLAPSST